MMPSSFEVAIARHAEHQVDADAGGHHGAHERRAVAGQVLGEAALHVSVQGHPYVMAGVPEGPREA
jgi:hypothetical protein